MIERIKNKILSVTELISLEINITGDNAFLITGIHLKSRNNKLIKLQEYQRITSLKDLAEKVPPKIPLSIAISGKGLLIRKKDSGSFLTNPVTDFLPGSNPVEFYYQTITEKNTSYAFIIRKEIVHDLQKQLLDMGFVLISISLGAAGITNILPFFAKEDTLVENYCYNIALTNNQIENIQAITPDYSGIQFPEKLIADQYYKDNLLISLGNAIETFITPLKQLDNGIINEKIHHTRSNYGYYKYVTAGGWFMLLFTLVILVINYFTFNYYFGKNQELSAEKLLSEQTTINREKLKAETDSIYIFLHNAGWDQPTNHSYIIDRIAALLPGTVVLTSFITAPKDEQSDEGNSFLDKKIIISGTSEYPTDLNIFINAIKNLSQIKNINLENYQYKKEINAAVFKLDISIL